VLDDQATPVVQECNQITFALLTVRPYLSGKAVFSKSAAGLNCTTL
jgi:hypothetical protein